MSGITVQKRLISQEEFRQMGEIGLLKPDEKVELIHGEIYNMAPIGSRHMSAVNQLTELLIPVFIHQFIVSVQNPILIDQLNELLPDVAILNTRKDRYRNLIPQSSDVVAVIEVSDTTYTQDKNVKLPLYASAGIPVFWIINIPNECIEAYSEPVSEQYRNLTLNFPGDEITLLGHKLSVSEILGV